MQTFRHKIFSCLYPALSALGAAVLLVFLFTDTAAAAECKSMAERVSRLLFLHYD